MNYAHISVNSLLTNRKQYISLFLVCFFGIGIILFSSFISDGMLSSVKEKAVQYYGGQLQFLGGNGLGTTKADEEIEVLKKYVPQNVKFFKRFDYDAATTSFFYEGECVQQRVIKGVDFAEEQEFLSKFKFEQGNSMPSGDYDCILISSKIAAMLNISAGDSLTIQMATVNGYTNTMDVVVQGVFMDSSLFGMYTSYLNIDSLRRISGYNSNYVNRLCMYFPNNEPDRNFTEKLQEQLKEEYPMYELCSDKQEFYDALFAANARGETLYGLITLDANIKEVQIINEAIKAVFILISIILILIISVGIGSTYRVIVMKRTTEIGTYRALGMKPSGVRALFLTETAILLLTSLIAGIILAFAASFIIAQFDFSFIPAFGLFLTEGKLVPDFNFIKVLQTAGIILVTTLISVLFTIHKIVHLSPVGALATTN